jgi:hypothetical protein
VTLLLHDGFDGRGVERIIYKRARRLHAAEAAPYVFGQTEIVKPPLNSRLRRQRVRRCFECLTIIGTSVKKPRQ